MTYEEECWYNGKLRTHCASCHRVVYANEAAAVTAAARISERKPMWPFLGACGYWHVTGNKRRAERASQPEPR